MHKKVFLSGNEAVATALRQINPDVFPAFPITPSTEIPQYFSNYVSNGLVDTEFITVESEHSSMSAAMGASHLFQITEVGWAAILGLAEIVDKFFGNLQ